MKLNNVLSYLMIWSIFLGALSYGQAEFEFYLNYLIFVLFISMYFIKHFNLSINKHFLSILLILMFISLLNCILMSVSFVLVFKQLIGIILSALAYYLLIKINNYDIEKLYKMYLNVAFIVCLIGLFQEISYIFHFLPGYDYSTFLPKWRIVPMGNLLRIDSIMMEPAALAIVLTPAMYLAINNLLSRKQLYIGRLQSFIILMAYLFTFSSVGYAGLICSLILYLYKNNYLNLKRKKAVWLFLAIPLLFLLFASVYASVGEIRTRMNDSIAVLMKSNLLDKKNTFVPRDTNLSTFVLYVNYKVILTSILERPLFGSGLGTYVGVYDKYVADNHLSDVQGIVFNRNDACALIFRLLAEVGIVGTLIILYMLGRFLIKNGMTIRACPLSYNLSIINGGIFVLILLRLFRLGHYFVDGFFFFIFLYYFSYKFNKKMQQNISL